ncbi:hypothetical protein CNMCM5793_004437 [Aspergillus hiratsukae]|uniref:ribonuclease H n=1 Tax=Aspergillus hiratsukae TaxID=1194566 RepID=A0A8H6UIX8_9EURO|nr:hypothetical protein CNMCM5793_004437 [Aspergillus hiratsukae]
MVFHTTGFVALIRNNRASAATRDHDDDPNDGSTHSGRFDNFIIEPVPGLDDDPTSPVYIPEEYEEVDWRIDYGDNHDPNDWSTHSGRFDNFIIEPVSGSDDDPRSPIYISEMYEGAESSIDDDDYQGSVIFRPGKYIAGTGQVIPNKFIPPNSSIRPQDLFPPGRRMDTSPPVLRFISRLNSNEMLIYTDGACLGNGQPNPGQAGPTGDHRPQTSNRAELRAVIAALQFRSWPSEGWKNFVIATDSTYVVEGATSWIKGWVQNGWRTRNGEPVKNEDLWKCLLGWCEDAATFPAKTKLEFWRIPREWNTEADGWAKIGAEKCGRPTTFARPWGNLL